MCIWKKNEYMYKNDLHSKDSVDYRILERMILIDKDSIAELYNKKNLLLEFNVDLHELFDFSRSVKCDSEVHSVMKVLMFIKDIVEFHLINHFIKWNSMVQKKKLLHVVQIGALIFQE